MADLSWATALTDNGGSGSGSTGVSDYDQLTNRPVINLTGENVVVSQLTTGVYNISGTWKITDDDETRNSDNDDLFYILNNGEVCKMTWLCAGQIKKVVAPINGTVDEIIIENVATTEDIFNQMVGEF